MVSDIISTDFKVYDECFECPCGCGVNTYDEAYLTFFDWSYCPKCGQKQVEHISEDIAYMAIKTRLFDTFKETNLAQIDYKDMLFLLNDGEERSIYFKDFDDFKRLIDKAVMEYLHKVCKEYGSVGM